MPEMGVIILTGHGDLENAIHAMKEGALNISENRLMQTILQ